MKCTAISQITCMDILQLIASVLLIIQNCFANESDLTGSCLIELQQYLYCVKQEVRYHAKIIGAEVTPSFKAKVDECFQK